MKRLVGGVVSVVVLGLAGVTPVVAAPAPDASHVANCAVAMGGQHVADCAQIMEKGVSECAQMTGPCGH